MGNRTRQRLGIAAVTAVLAVAVVGVASVHANPSLVLPSVAADRLVASSLAALAQPFTISGDVTTHVDLGIPQLPGSLGGVAGQMSALIGDQRFKLWRSPDGVRVSHLLDFAEQDLVANVGEAWVWDSQSQTAIHVAFPSPAPTDASTLNPADIPALAQRILETVAPYAEVSVDGTAVVAGRPSYELVLTPRSTLTKIGRIAMTIDAETRLPLSLQVFPRSGGSAAIGTGFTRVSFEPIDPSMFVFTPPPDATVREATDLVHAMQQGASSQAATLPSDARVFGSGFEVRVAYRLDAPLPREIQALLPYAGPLASVIAVEHGGVTWLLAGFVDPSTLQKDAATLP